MDKYSLVFRSMLISKSMQKNQNIYERMFRAIRENRIWEVIMKFNYRLKRLQFRIIL